MTIDDIRRENARAIANEMSTHKEFAERLKMKSAQVSQIIGKTPNKNIGSVTARKIEKEFGKPKGWMDVVHMPEHVDTESENSASQANFDDGITLLTTFNNVSPAGRKMILAFAAGVESDEKTALFPWIRVKRS